MHTKTWITGLALAATAAVGWLVYREVDEQAQRAEALSEALSKPPPADILTAQNPQYRTGHPSVSSATADRDTSLNAALVAGTAIEVPTKIIQAEEEQFSGPEFAIIRQILLHFNTGNYSGALVTADNADRGALTPRAREWIDGQMLVLLTAAGWSHLRLGQCRQAIPIFWRADAEKRTGDVAKGLAFCLRKAGNLFRAEELLAWFRESHRNETNVDLLYADVLESLGDYSSARRVLTEIRAANNSEEEEVEKRILQMKGREEESHLQQTIRSRYFDLRYRALDHEALAEFALRTLDAAIDEFVERFGFREPTSTIEVVLYPDDGFKDLVLDSPEWAAGVFDGRMRIPVRSEWVGQARSDKLAEILRHELVHALLAHMSDYRTIPAWFDEGFAQYASCIRASCRSFRFTAKPASFLNIHDFEKPFASFNRVRARAAYQQGLYLVLMIEKTSDFGDPLREIVSSITANSPLGSDAILDPAEITFAGLVAQARTQWQKRYAQFR